MPLNPCLVDRGGGIWEPDVFFDACDEFGVILYTDQQFTWGAIGGTEQEAAELKYQLKRNSHHPSIALWDACNECGGGGLYDSFVMPKVAQVDRSRPVWPSCPSDGWASGADRLSSRPNGKTLDTRTSLPDRPIGFPFPQETHGPYTAFLPLKGGVTAMPNITMPLGSGAPHDLVLRTCDPTDKMQQWTGATLQHAGTLSPIASAGLPKLCISHDASEDTQARLVPCEASSQTLQYHANWTLSTPNGMCLDLDHSAEGTHPVTPLVWYGCHPGPSSNSAHQQIKYDAKTQLLYAALTVFASSPQCVTVSGNVPGVSVITHLSTCLLCGVLFCHLTRGVITRRGWNRPPCLRGLAHSTRVGIGLSSAARAGPRSRA